MALYIFGTHAKAIGDAESVKTQIRRSAPLKAGLLAGAFFAVGQQAYTNVQPLIRQSAASPARPIIKYYTSGPQADPTQILPAIRASAPAPLSTPQPIVRYYVSAPQMVDLTLSSQNWEPLPARQGVLGSYLLSAPQVMDLTLPAQTWEPVPSRQGILGAQVNAYPVDISQLAPQVWLSLRSPPVIPNPVAPFYSLAPQLADFTLPARIFTPSPASQGLLGARVNAYPIDTTQVAPIVWSSLIPPPIIPNPVAPYYKTYPQFEERATVLLWPAQVSGFTPRIIPQVQAAPQVVDLTVRPQISGPVSTTQGPTVVGYTAAPLQVDLSLPARIFSPGAAAQGPVLVHIRAGQQTQDFTLQAKYYSASYSIVILTGPTVRPNAFVPGQYDLTVNGTQIWTPSTLRKFTPPIVGQSPVELGLGLSLMRLGGHSY